MLLDVALSYSRFNQAGRVDSFGKRFTLACQENDRIYFYRTNDKGKNLKYWEVKPHQNPFNYTDWRPVAPKS